MFSRTIRQSDATSNLWMQQSSARPNSSLHAISSKLAGIRISDHTYITMGDAATKWYQHCRRQSPRLNAPRRKAWPNHIFKAETHGTWKPSRKRKSLPNPTVQHHPPSKRRNKKRPSTNLHVLIHSTRPMIQHPIRQTADE